MIARWTEFYGGPRIPTRDRLHVTINHKGLILLNKKAWETLREPEAVILYFDQTNSIVGIKKAPIERPNAFPVKRSGYNRLVHAGTFCTHFRFTIDRTMVFNDIKFDDEEAILRLPFHSATAISRPRKKRKHGDVEQQAAV